MNLVLQGYAAAAPALVAAYEALVPEQVYGPVLDLFPNRPARVVDIGAGTGRDAAWLAGQGHDVLAVEPVRELREVGQAIHGSRRLSWLDDLLPDLASARRRGPFDVAVASGVWHHLPESDQVRAIKTLASLLAPAGTALVSLRHGPAPPDRPGFPVPPDATVERALRADLHLVRRADVASIQPANQAAGVTWTWLALRRG